MMIPVTLPSGREILLSCVTDDAERNLPEELSGDKTGFEDIAFHLEFEDLVNVVTEIGETLHKALAKIRPQKAKIDLSVGVDSRTGRVTAFFVDGGVTGALNLSLEWGSSKPESA